LCVPKREYNKYFALSLFLPLEEKELQSQEEVLMRLYETAFLIAPNVAEDETEQLIEQMAGVVTENKGEMVEVDTWGKRKLAYQIQKFDAAFYVFFRYKSEADIPAELERRFKQTESILRYLTVLMDEEPKVRRKNVVKPQPKEAAGERMTAPSPEPMSKKEPEAAKEPAEAPAAAAEATPEVRVEEAPPAAPEPVPAEEAPAAEDAKEEEK
jgi:small subunit ribosomal protein S6